MRINPASATDTRSHKISSTREAALQRIVQHIDHSVLLQVLTLLFVQKAISRTPI